MKKKLDLLEHFKTVVLVVLFLITILLLYLCFNQHGRLLSISEIFPNGHARENYVNEEDYILPSYLIQTNDDGSVNLFFDKKESLFLATKECAKSLIASSAVSLDEISEEEYIAKALEKNSIQSVFSFGVPFNDFSNELAGKTFELPAGFSLFKTILFADSSKECFYMQDVNGRYFRLTAGENYYSIARISRDLNSSGKKVSYSNDLYYAEKVLAANNMLAKNGELNFDSDNIAEDIFGDTFDFVRKIVDSFGNETYMYGYGQKRLTINIDGSFEFKEEITALNTPNFYTDLDTSLHFLAKTIGIGTEDFRIKNVEILNDGTSNYYRFTYNNGQREVITDVYTSGISYFYIAPEN